VLCCQSAAKVYYYYEIVHEVHNKNTQKDNKNIDKLEFKKKNIKTCQISRRAQIHYKIPNVIVQKTDR